MYLLSLLASRRFRIFVAARLELLHRNSVPCLVLVRDFASVLCTRPINQQFASLARGLQSKRITANFHHRWWADGDEAMR
jgi:hypothetical protein